MQTSVQTPPHLLLLKLLPTLGASALCLQTSSEYLSLPESSYNSHCNKDLQRESLPPFNWSFFLLATPFRTLYRAELGQYLSLNHSCPVKWPSFSRLSFHIHLWCSFWFPRSYYSVKINIVSIVIIRGFFLISIIAKWQKHSGLYPTISCCCAYGHRQRWSLQAVAEQWVPYSEKNQPAELVSRSAPLWALPPDTLQKRKHRELRTPDERDFEMSTGLAQAAPDHLVRVVLPVPPAHWEQQGHAGDLSHHHQAPCKGMALCDSISCPSKLTQ